MLVDVGRGLVMLGVGGADRQTDTWTNRTEQTSKQKRKKTEEEEMKNVWMYLAV